MPAMQPVVSRYLIPVDLPPKRQHIVSLRAELDVMPGHRAGNSARLVRSLEMSPQPIAVLSNLHMLLDHRAVVDVLGVNRPAAACVLRWLLRARRPAAHTEHQD